MAVSLPSQIYCNFLQEHADIFTTLLKKITYAGVISIVLNLLVYYIQISDGEC